MEIQQKNNALKGIKSPKGINKGKGLISNIKTKIPSRKLKYLGVRNRKGCISTDIIEKHKVVICSHSSMVFVTNIDINPTQNPQKTHKKEVYLI